MMNIKTPLYDEILEELNGLNKIELGSDEYKTTVDGLTKLVDRVIEMEKMETDLREKKENREIDTDFKAKQLKFDNIDRLARNGISVVGLIAQVGLTVWGAKKSWIFEEEGTITSTMGREFMKRILPKKI